MASFHFDLVSPEKLLFAGDVGQVDLPGSEGDLGVLAGHAPLVTALRPGILVVYREGGDLRVVVNGGFAEGGPAGLTLPAAMAGSRRGVRPPPPPAARQGTTEGRPPAPPPPPPPTPP